MAYSHSRSNSNNNNFRNEMAEAGIGIPAAGGGRFRKFSGGAPQRECDDVNDPIDYKNLPLLHKYLTPQGKLQSRKRTKYCAQCQRQLAAAVKQARFVGLLPYVV
ncbi:MAG: 30S ribosomal protein S18 [Planctomycetota bacterium]